jgi:hypothetical protein
MAHDGSPLEYSWKWNTSNGEPDIRYSWEPFNPGSGTTADPQNHALSLDYMRKVTRVLPDVDFTWANFFLQEIETGDQPASRFLHAVEYNRTKKFGLKSYFLPRNYKLLEGGDSVTMKQWDESIVKLNPKNAGRDTLMNFLGNNAEGKVLEPVYVRISQASSSS